ncbi:MAG: hypothetical protein Q7K40_02860 [bacterium]|nr:hypothetical protein [bacterium]
MGKNSESIGGSRFIPRSNPDVQQSNLPEVSFRAKIKGNGSVNVILVKKKNKTFRVSFAGEHLRSTYQVIDEKISRETLEKSVDTGILEVSTRIRIISLDVVQIRRILNI